MLGLDPPEIFVFEAFTFAKLVSVAVCVRGCLALCVYVCVCRKAASEVAEARADQDGPG